ncbi:MAG TPA: Holliday junction branch migration protein RuvA [Cyclobacteriaceae bacterium]|nr:Holliday junction branch migration protein RuvA [Cyclobacteriaceae bacterium]HMV09082.1 Holliday junction branch migration protein RuvA [Cyclobacteriaceae bacterium]HMV90033.1 Holliday junction branch migration protein RuvA [Cyclobacteriaceae bacterium]HMW99513.1 Holliday junction branch migration protein RuvA [Cyclobacteriaceae bacterium]HMX48698.1 Holliday junction branch migration protein RuvA [Cyclobacteriaceae bacterium]
MIAFLKGKLVHKDPTYVIIDVNGVGYHVHISLQTFGEIKDQENILLFTHLAIREDAHVLFGFSKEAEKKMFQLLISVNGVGPSTAIVMLSYMSIDELRSAIIHDDAVTLQRIKGIGGKTAQRVIIELKDKLKKDSYEEILPGTGVRNNTLRNEALSALVTLGIARNVAEKSVDMVLKKSGNTITLEDLVKQALKNA